MGITQIVQPFYTQLPAEDFRLVPRVGQFCRTVVPSLRLIPQVMDVERADPQEHLATKFEIRYMHPTGDFVKKNRLPIHRLNLGETEEILLHKGKLRPAIIVSTGVTLFEDIVLLLKRMGRRHLQQNCLLVVPLYGIQTEGHPGGFPQVMVARIKGMMYRQFFFCPAQDSPLTIDSVARLDRLQILLHESVDGVRSPAYIPLQTSLSTEATGVLLAMLRQFFGATDEAEGDLEAMRELAMGTIPPEALAPVK